MPDPRTLTHYQQEAQRYLTQYNQITPPRPRALAQTFLPPPRALIDIGCGSGRDLAWLKSQGHTVEGIEPVEALASACDARPDLTGVPIHRDTLPDLAALRASGERAGRFDGVLMSAVLMHLPREEALRAVESALWLLRVGGRAIISVRAAVMGAEGEGEGEGEREGERLFTRWSLWELRWLCEVAGGRVVWWEESPEESGVSAGLGRGGRGVVWRTVVVERAPEGGGDGLALIQRVLIHDRKTSSYKFALLRALCDLARLQPFCARYDERDPVVWVPLRAVAERWVRYYWPLRGTRQMSAAEGKALGVFRVFEEHLLDQVSAPEAFDDPRAPLQGALREIAKLILKGPVSFTLDSSGAPHFGQLSGRALAARPWGRHPLWDLGALSAPVEMWADLRRYWHWIEESLISRWALYSAQGQGPRQVAELRERLTASSPWDGEPERDTLAVRALTRLPDLTALRVCVWSGAVKGPDELDVDHLIPFSIRRQNELWNLLPATQHLNRSKGDAAPSLALLRASRGRILSAWGVYLEHLRARFERELLLGLGVSLVEGREAEGLSAAFERLCLLVSSVLSAQQAVAWAPRGWGA